MKRVFRHPKSNFRIFIESFYKNGGFSLSIGSALIISLILSNFWIVLTHAHSEFIHLAPDINNTLSDPYFFQNDEITESKLDTINIFNEKIAPAKIDSNYTYQNSNEVKSLENEITQTNDNIGLITEDDNLDDFLFDENLSFEEDKIEEPVVLDSIPIDSDTSFIAESDYYSLIPSKEYSIDKSKNLLGTDEIGRDLFTYLILGFEIYFLGGLLSILFSLIFGILLGTIRVYYESKLIGKTARIFLEFLQGLPKILFLFTSVIIFGVNFYSIMITIGFVSSLKVSDMLENRIRTLSKEEFIDSAKQLGLSDFKIITKHILFYNCRDVIITSMAFVIADTILLETTMAFLNYGIQMQEVFTGIDIISWGAFLEQGKRGINSGEYWLVLYPSLMILFTILAFNLIGNGLKTKYHIK